MDKNINMNIDTNMKININISVNIDSNKKKNMNLNLSIYVNVYKHECLQAFLDRRSNAYRAVSLSLLKIQPHLVIHKIHDS